MPDAPINDSYDVVVMGGGPGGSAASALVAEAGYSVLLVEREAVPRFHVGESLMPESFWSFERLGVLDKMRNSNFVKKLSVQFVSHSGKESNPFFFEKHDPRECSQTWQVERSVFDQMLFDNAAEKGACCRDKTRVTNVLFDDGRATGVELGLEDGSTQQVKAKVVVDATGLSAILANHLNLKQEYEHLKKIAVWTYFKNAEREPGPHGGATIILHTKLKDSWFWFIPLRDNITSVGVVGNRDYMLDGRSTPENTFAEELELCGAMQRRLASAEQVEKHRIAREFSYKTSRQSGDGWVLVGDAFGFIDPIYSSGVYFALKSGELAADAIVEGLQNNDLSAAQLGKWISDYSSGTQWIHKLVEAYYTNEFSFGKFLQGHPHHIGHLTDLLIGRIFHDTAGDIFDEMEPAMAEAVKMAIPK
ncbi:MAG: FAD-dependent oxidoreductase [Planctomycetaceae bacterium]|jgi:geranylgeranyl reductase family protein|nr:FAD-dependent oxidoreductase [Planctomycetaceae bacterium]